MNNENYIIYGELTKTDNEKYKSENFFKGLEYRKNALKIIEILESIEYYKIVRGFLCENLSDDNSINTFKNCHIKLLSDKNKEKAIEVINNHKYVDEVKVLSENEIVFLIK
ncbi:hypothetical protein PBI_PBS1_120 [Bacillus phage PBS1]|uniref:Uncharacterized protein n=1 Tax=Bacillus phage PBS1 TaxID=2884423 RepID=A0A223LDB0_BPPB1|nr:hypothetical protein FK780_gp120 [Bacillus phage PBS1]AST99942.1 hypothetical protein PBI_PBS1_120 [Bacillus phage PBS1]BDE75239.1 hypothetical protein [Bacillus phage PBS1]